MKFRIYSLTSPKEKPLLEMEKDYLKRLSPYMKLEVSDGKISHPSHRSPDEALYIEKEKIDSLMGKDTFLILLDSMGKQLDSLQFSKKIESLFSHSKKEALFIIGGPFGIHADIKKKADLLISLSSLTFTHNFARLILIEQLYRALSIIRGTSYHK